jgi:hypothetical protein
MYEENERFVSEEKVLPEKTSGIKSHMPVRNNLTGFK